MFYLEEVTQLRQQVLIQFHCDIHRQQIKPLFKHLYAVHGQLIVYPAYL